MNSIKVEIIYDKSALSNGIVSKIAEGKPIPLKIDLAELRVSLKFFDTIKKLAMDKIFKNEIFNEPLFMYKKDVQFEQFLKDIYFYPKFSETKKMVYLACFFQKSLRFWNKEIKDSYDVMFDDIQRDINEEIGVKIDQYIAEKLRNDPSNIWEKYKNIDQQLILTEKELFVVKEEYSAIDSEYKNVTEKLKGRTVSFKEIKEKQHKLKDELIKIRRKLDIATGKYNRVKWEYDQILEQYKKAENNIVQKQHKENMLNSNYGHSYTEQEQKYGPIYRVIREKLKSEILKESKIVFNIEHRIPFQILHSLDSKGKITASDILYAIRVNYIGGDRTLIKDPHIEPKEIPISEYEFDTDMETVKYEKKKIEKDNFETKTKDLNVYTHFDILQESIEKLNSGEKDIVVIVTNDGNIKFQAEQEYGITYPSLIIASSNDEIESKLKNVFDTIYYHLANLPEFDEGELPKWFLERYNS